MSEATGKELTETCCECGIPCELDAWDLEITGKIYCPDCTPNKIPF